MIKGKKFDNLPSLEHIMSITSGGYDVYKYYLGRFGKCMKRPWGRRESKPSFSIFRNGNIWLWKDFATEESGNAVSFIQKMFGLSFKEAIKRIMDDFNYETTLPEGSTSFEDNEPEEKDYSRISYITQPFNKRHHEFWNCVGVTEEWCKKYNCFALKKCAINGVNYPVSEYETAFVYLSDDQSKVKLYFPDREKGRRFRTNIPSDYLHNYSNLQKCEKLVITKSNKDMIVISTIFPNVIATQSESVYLFSDKVVEKINKISDEVWLFYGSDEDGVRKSANITSKNKWKHINIPKTYLKEGINDPYSFVKKYGIKSLELLMQSKGLL